MKQDHYKVLGVAENADEDTIKKAYKKIAIENHPDNNPNNPEAEKKMQEASEAYAVLSDQVKRKAYDETRKSKVSGQNANSAVNDFVNQVVDDFVNSFQTYFYGKPSSSQNRSEQKVEEPEKIDFSEIKEIDCQIMECEEVMKNLKLEEKQIENKIEVEKENIHNIVEEVRKSKTSDEGYIKALDYIEKIKKRDSSRILSLTITEKQNNIYEKCVDLVRLVEKQLKELKENLEKERIEPLQKQKEEKNKEYWDIHRKKSLLKRSYFEHRLRRKYEDFKKMQVKEESDKRAI